MIFICVQDGQGMKKVMVVFENPALKRIEASINHWGYGRHEV